MGPNQNDPIREIGWFSKVAFPLFWGMMASREQQEGCVAADALAFMELAIQQVNRRVLAIFRWYFFPPIIITYLILYSEL